MDTPLIIAGRYRIIRELAAGGMGVVYEVERLDNGERFAMKTMLKGHDDPTLVTRFRREASASASIANEHVVKVFELDRAPELDNALFLVMELLVGEDLGAMIGRGPIPPRDVLEYVWQIGGALSAAHAAGIVHRDLKPQNLFVHSTPSGRRVVKLLDFGVARLLDPDATSVTDRRGPIGTMHYISPEQLGPGGNAGPTTDIWALGLITLELLVGASYWRGRGMKDLLFEVNRGPTEPPSARWPNLPRAFDAWFLRSCAVSPVHRFQSVREQTAALAPILQAM
jgi:serine/threonine protein kinase